MSTDTVSTQKTAAAEAGAALAAAADAAAATVEQGRNSRWSLEEVQQQFRPLIEAGSAHLRATTDLLTHLQTLPGETWQDRWVLFEASCDGVEDWCALASTSIGTKKRQHLVYWPMRLMVVWDVIRPSYAWMHRWHAQLGLRFLRLRDPSGLAEFEQAATAASIDPRSMVSATNSLALMMARTGKPLRQLDAADLLEMRDFSAAANRREHGLHVAWRALQGMGTLQHEATSMPITNRRIRQRTPEELVDSYHLTGVLREPIVEYLRQRSASLDHSSLRNLAYYLTKAFCGDLLTHHPDLDTFRLTREQAAGWKQRISIHPDGRPRGNHIGALFMIRAFYLDMAEWSLHDPYWLQWTAPSPIPREDVKGYLKQRRRVTSRMQQRTRNLAPFLDRLVTQAEHDLAQAEQVLAAALAAGDGGTITINSNTWTVRTNGQTKLFRACRDGEPVRRLNAEEDRAFWTWAVVETLRGTGLRMEEMLELTHLSVQSYRSPTGETVPLLHISPSKNDEERLIVAGPELVHVLTRILKRLRSVDGTVPLTRRWDSAERELGPAQPHLFVRRYGTRVDVINRGTITTDLQRLCQRAQLTTDGEPVVFTAHDFRRLYATEALASGLPPHIVQVLMGHKSLATTQGYAAIYPQDVIRHHRTFLAQRRQRRPSEEYREPTAAEWDEFEAHFAKRKVSLGSCGRAYGTNCQHEHACIRCALLRPDPAQTRRLEEIIDNLGDRIDEADTNGWLGEVDGLKTTLAAAEDKLQQMRRLDTGSRLIDLGLPASRASSKAQR